MKLVLILGVFAIQGCFTERLLTNAQVDSKGGTDFICYIKPAMISANNKFESDFKKVLPKDSLELCVVVDSTMGKVDRIYFSNSTEEMFTYKWKQWPGVSCYAYCKNISPVDQMSSPLLSINTSSGEYHIPIIPNYAVMEVFKKGGRINVHYGAIFYGLE